MLKLGIENWEFGMELGMKLGMESGSANQQSGSGKQERNSIPNSHS
jgi:hypothetical protein